MAHFLLLNGPNLNLLGTREPGIYGDNSLDQIEKRVLNAAAAAGHSVHAEQSNAEHELIDAIQTAGSNNTDFIIINPAAYTHTSIAIRDALLATAIPFIEVHLSNTQSRESFRHRSMLADIAVGTISGFGALGYELALQAAIKHIKAE